MLFVLVLEALPSYFPFPWFFS